MPTPRDTVKLDRDRFDSWADSAWPAGGGGKYSPSQVAKTAGISKSSFFFQRSKDYVEASVVVALARSLQRNPLDDLLHFEEFASFKEHREPEQSEVLSQVGPNFLMEELLARLHHEKSTHYLPAMPEPYGLKRWLDSMDMHGKYGEIAEAMDLANIRVLSKKINENRLSLGQLVALCEYDNLNGRFGMVVTGVLTWEEAGFPFDLREKVLMSAPGDTVIEALWRSRKWLERAVQVKELESGVYESFG